MAYFEHEGCNLHYEEYGHGTPLLLVHGWVRAPWTGKTDPGAVGPLPGDRPGRTRPCRSDKPRERYSIAGFSADLIALIEHLNLGPTHYVGLSMGGMIGFQLAWISPTAQKPVHRQQRARSQTAQPRRLLAVVQALEPDARPQSWHHRQSPGRQIVPKPEQADLRQKMAERWAKNDKHAYLASFDAIVGWGVQERLSKVSCPTLIVSADRDYTPVSLKETYVKLLPDARLVVIADSRHATPLDNPNTSTRRCSSFLPPSIPPPSGSLTHAEKIALVAGSVLFAANLMAATPAKAPHVLLDTTNGQIEIELDPVEGADQYQELLITSTASTTTRFSTA
jgi:pimeloyl-ACP methyl ester carboxylesterase